LQKLLLRPQQRKPFTLQNKARYTRAFLSQILKGNDVKPQTKIKGLTFFPVPEFNAPTVVFGADERAFFKRHDLPDVPAKFEDIAQNLFFSGGKVPELHPRVNRQKAFAALSAWLKSFAPAHEAKIATAAYALWLWTDDTVLDTAPIAVAEPKLEVKNQKTPRGSARKQRRAGAISAKT
jgi:hypothetical protein